MILHAKIQAVAHEQGTRLVRVTEEADIPLPLRYNEALLLKDASSANANGFGALLRVGHAGLKRGEIQLPDTMAYLRTGDIVRITPDSIRVLYRRHSPHNVLFVTERCNSRCLMCSQPPKDVDDGFLVDEILEALPLMSRETKELCITGGEPTLLKTKLVELIQAVKLWLPNTALHMLSNGRLFAYAEFAAEIASIQHPDFVVGIPLYSDIASRHDFVVQAKGAFDQTIRGMLNLARVSQRFEIRVVLHKQTVERLPDLARFIAANLPMTAQVVLMGLEMTGYTRSNLHALWIDPLDYQAELKEAVDILLERKIKTWIYNHQLCVLDRELWAYAKRSISDWKNIYMPECKYCDAQDKCGGFFASAQLRYSRGIRPFCGGNAGTEEVDAEQFKYGLTSGTTIV